MQRNCDAEAKNTCREKLLSEQYISAEQSNLEASQVGEKLFFLLTQYENIPYLQHFLEHGDRWEEQ